MYTYAVDPGGEYITPEESRRRHPGGKRGFYVNLTNRCPCACTFCLRSLKQMPAEHSLWLTAEPAVSEVEAALDALPWALASELVFCGFGEPTERLDAVTELLRWTRRTHPDIPTRLNTNGLSDLIHGRDTAPDFQGLLDTVSISLNASTPERYLALTRSRFGIGSFEAMLRFARACRDYVPNVVLTVVDHVEDAAEIKACREIAASRGLKLRVRSYESQ